VRFHIRKFQGDFYYLTRHEHPPIKLVPPYQHFGTDDYETDTLICNMEVGDHYLGINGGHHCAVYDVVADEFHGECEEYHHAMHVVSTTGSHELHVNHFELGLCQSHGWVDYFLTVDEEMSHQNLLFEVQDMGEANNPQSLGVFSFKDAIPDDRQSEIRTNEATDGTYVIYWNYHELKRATYFLSVRCNGGDARFRVVALLVHAQLDDGHSQHGEVCRDGWMYHFFDARNANGTAAESGAGGHRRVLLGSGATSEESMHVGFHIRKYQGSMYLVTRHEVPPIKLTPPYKLMSDESEVEDVTVCDMAGEKVYLGLYGGPHCAIYDVVAHVEMGGNCSEIEHFAAVDVGHVEPLELEHFQYGACDAGSWAFHLVTLSDEEARNNLGARRRRRRACRRH